MPRGARERGRAARDRSGCRCREGLRSRRPLSLLSGRRRRPHLNAIDAPTVIAKLLVHLETRVLLARIGESLELGAEKYACGYLIVYIQSFTSARIWNEPPPGIHRRPTPHGNAKRVPN